MLTAMSQCPIRLDQQYNGQVFSSTSDTLGCRFPHHLTSLSVRSRHRQQWRCSTSSVLSLGQHRPNTKQCHHHTQYSVYNSDTVTCSTTATDPDERLCGLCLDGRRVQRGQWSLIGLIYDGNTDRTAECTASVTDSDGGSATDSATITVDNRAPSGQRLRFLQQPQPKRDDLVCTGSGSTDADGQTVTYTYSWTSDAGGSVSGATVLASETSAGRLGPVWRL